MDAQQETPNVDGEALTSTPVGGGADAPTEPEDAAAAGQVPEATIDVEEVEDFGAALANWESGLKAVKEGDVVRGKVLKVLEKEVIYQFATPKV